MPAHPRDVADVDAKDLLPQARGERAHDVHDVFSIHEAHLKVNLGELSLPVGTRIFVPEAPHNLEIAIATRDHQDLFEDLWTLGQGIPLARVLAAGHDEVAGAFGTGFDQERGFHFKETFVAEVVANDACHLRTGSQDLLHAGATKIDVAVLQTLVFGDFVRLVVVGQNGGRLGLAEHLDAFGHQLNGAGLQFVVGPTVPKTNFAFHANAVFAAKTSGDLHQLAVGIFQIAHHLGEPRSVPEIEENQALPLFSVGIDPAAEPDGCAGVGVSKVATGMGAFDHGLGCPK